MKMIIVLAAIAGLAGCSTTGTGFNNTEVVVQREYVVRTAPDALKTLPPLPPALANPKTASNTQIGTWINNTEEYVANLEAMVQTLVNFYEKPVTSGEVTAAGGMRAVTPLATPTPTAARVIQPQTTAAPIPTPAASAPRYSDPIQRLRAQ
jgi:hypothetical protein